MSKIYYNGRIVTMEGNNAKEMLQKAPEAVLVENGFISKVGSLTACEEKTPKAEKINLSGRCLMPSFIDTHSHVVMNGQMALCANLSECESFDEIITALKKYIKENNITSKGAVMGFGYDHNFLKEAAQPDKRVLNQVSTEIPIMILHVSAHLACVNSAAMQLVGVDEHTPNPEGGLLARMEGSMEPSGYLEETAMTIFSEMIGKRMDIDVSDMLIKMQDVYLENGVTTVQDGATLASDFQVLKMASASGLLKVDAVAYPIMPNGGVALMHEYKEEYQDYKDHLKIGGYKLVLDGSPQGRSAWMSEPYQGGEEGYCGYPWMKDEEVEKYVLLAVEENKQILVHCNGDAASEQFLNAYEKAVEKTENKKDLRPVMIHCQTVRNDQLERMAKLKMIASIFVGHVWFWGDIHVKNLGDIRGNHISPVKDAIKRGVCVNFHQDTPVTKPNMLHSIWCAVNRLSRGGKVIGEGQKVSVFEAVAAVTIHAAYEYFEEDTKGSIREGKRADLVILDKSPFDVNPMDIKNIHVLETIKDGKVVYNVSSL